MINVLVERELDWPSHIAAVEQTLPYMFAPGHLDCARYGLYYLRNMQAVPFDIWKQFMKGEHTMHHNPCRSNGVSSDMFIESNYMSYGHGPGGVVKAR